MKKSLAIAIISTFVLTASTSAADAADNKVVTGAKKVGLAIVWPFKKIGEGAKVVGKKVTGK